MNTNPTFNIEIVKFDYFGAHLMMAQGALLFLRAVAKSTYCDNLFVKRSIPTGCLVHMGINP